MTGSLFVLMKRVFCWVNDVQNLLKEDSFNANMYFIFQFSIDVLMVSTSGADG